MQIIIVIVILIGLPLLIIVAIEYISLKITKRLGKKQNYENYILQIKQRKLAIQKDILDNNKRLEIEYEFYLDKSWECSEQEYTQELKNKYVKLINKIDAEWYLEKNKKQITEIDLTQIKG
jgi:hypothetical protein